MKAYKAFNKDMTCRGFQYEVGKTYKHDGAVEICSSGFHACLNPLDCLNYYSLTDTKFAEVELSGETVEHSDDTKIASAEITIKAELTLPDFIKRSIDWVFDSIKGKDVEPSASGNDSKLAASGDYSQLAATGNDSKLAASGNDSQLAATGNDSKLAASGDYSQLAASGDGSVIASSGIKATAKGAKGTWISLAEFNDDIKCIGFAVGCIGKEGLKEDVYYKAKDGKLVEA